MVLGVTPVMSVNVETALVATKTVESKALTQSFENEVKITGEATEALIGEKGLFEQMDTIRHSSIESVEARNEVTINEIPPKNQAEKVDTRNQSVEGQNHPESGVPFLTREIELKHRTIEGVFPDFREFSSFTTELPESMYEASDQEQSAFCDEKLKNALENGDLDISVFTGEEIDMIRNGDKPRGWTWHHNESPGVMELVPTDIHAKTGHTGGRSLWGGGTDARS